jgi:hypothetical protein
MITRVLTIARTGVVKFIISVIKINKIMKKILVALSLICFVAVNVSSAQTQTSTSKETKTETVATKSTDAATPACNHSMSKACCKKGGSKACTSKDKAKADAVTEPKGSK